MTMDDLPKTASAKPQPKTGAQPGRLSPEEARKWATVGMLAAMALVLSYAETFVPIPLPGVKLGLANAVVAVALALIDFKSGCCIAAIKVLATGFLFGSPIMMAYSAAGTLLATLTMGLLIRLLGGDLVLATVAGALMHITGQLAVAWLMLGTPLVWYSAPILVLASSITGVATGMVAKKLASPLEPIEA